MNMVAEKNTAKELLSFLEYRAFYREPIFEAWDRYGAIALALFRAFREWNVGLESISVKPFPTNASEMQMSVDLLNKRFSFVVGLGAGSLFVLNPNWEEVELITKVARAGIGAIRAGTNTEIDKQVLTLSVHLEPQGRSVRDITSTFVSLDASPMLGENIRSYGFSVYTDNSSWVVDASALYAGALFIRLTRVFGPGASFEEIAGVIKTDEDHVLELLRLRLD
jgi:hypothetical protein